MFTPRAIDSHCHVQFNAYASDGDAVVKVSREANVGMLVVGTQSTTSARAVAMAERGGDDMFAAIGLHPNHLHVMHFDEDELSVKTRSERFDVEVYSKLASSPKVVAVGECGLDFYRLPEGVPLEEVRAIQHEQLLAQLAFADAQDLPVIFHCRDAHTELLALLRDVRSRGGLKRGGVIHSFTGTPADAEGYLALGLFLGLNGIVTFPPRKSAPEAHVALLDVVRTMPLDRMLLETDAPYLTPLPDRGARNEPAKVLAVAAHIAALRGVDVEVLLAQTVENTLRLFSKMRNGAA